MSTGWCRITRRTFRATPHHLWQLDQTYEHLTAEQVAALIETDQAVSVVEYVDSPGQPMTRVEHPMERMPR